MNAATSIEDAVMIALQSLDVRVRSVGITDASRAVDPESLVDLVADQSNAIKRNAAIDALTRGGARSVPTLIRALRHKDVEVIMFAAGILGKTRDATAVPHLIRLLDHDDINVTQGAIESLASLRAAGAVDALIAMLDRDPWLRFSAIHALGEIGDARAVGPLAALLRQPDGFDDAILPALGRIGSNEAIRVLSDDLSQSCAEDDRFDVCLRAIGRALQQRPDEGALAKIEAWAKLATPDASEVHLHLLKALSSSTENVRAEGDELELKEAAMEVIRALRLRPLYGALVRAARDPNLREPLRFCILSLGAETAPALAIGLLSPEAGIRLLACQCAGALALSEVAPQLERLLTDRDEDVRAVAVEAVARVGREGALPLLINALEDRSDVAGQAVAAALKQMDAETVSRALDGPRELSPRAQLLATEVMRASPHGIQRPFLQRTLRHPSAELRRAAVAALARQPWLDLVEDLAPLLADPVVEVRREAIVALGQCRSTRARELLFSQIPLDPETRTYAIRTLGELGGCAVAPVLAAMLEREAPLARIAIIGALADLRDPAAEPLLVRALADVEPEVRRSAVDALARFGTATAVRHGLAAARDPEWQVRAASVELLSLTNDPPSMAALERLCFDENTFVADAARARLDQKKPL